MALEDSHSHLLFEEHQLLLRMSNCDTKGTMFNLNLGALQLCPLRCLSAPPRAPGLISQVDESPILVLSSQLWKRDTFLPVGSHWNDGLLLPVT